MDVVSLKLSTLARNLCNQVTGLKYADALEMVAKSAGFESYRAAKALPERHFSLESACHEAAARALREAATTVQLFDDATMKGDYMLDSVDCANILEALSDREFELARRERQKAVEKAAQSKTVTSDGATVHLECEMIDWEVYSHQSCDSDISGFEEYRRQRYVAKLMTYSGWGGGNSPTLAVEVMPLGCTAENSNQMDSLSLVIEINDGVPCVHVSNDLIGDQRLAIFSTRDGVLVRTSESEMTVLPCDGNIDDEEAIVTELDDVPVLDRVFANNCHPSDTVAFCAPEMLSGSYCS